MVIVSPILERDPDGFLWNTAVVIDATGEVLGISRKTHIPISGRHSETYFYNPSQLGVPVFQVNPPRIIAKLQNCIFIGISLNAPYVIVDKIWPTWSCHVLRSTSSPALVHASAEWCSNCVQSISKYCKIRGTLVAGRRKSGRSSSWLLRGKH